MSNDEIKKGKAEIIAEIKRYTSIDYNDKLLFEYAFKFSYFSHELKKEKQTRERHQQLVLSWAKTDNPAEVKSFVSTVSKELTKIKNELEIRENNYMDNKEKQDKLLWEKEEKLKELEKEKDNEILRLEKILEKEQQEKLRPDNS